MREGFPCQFSLKEKSRCGATAPHRLSLSKKKENLCDGKEESYERLRPQARFGAQPPLKAAALGAKITQEGFLKVNCRKAAREGGLGHSFLIISFLKLIKGSKNLFSMSKRLFKHAEAGAEQLLRTG